ncbi:MAG TPA: serine/threonine-protein kinase [Aggregatilineales bacterium]|nr:serine/threonine-protein kinase [Aggregatilineales bacterium]
MTDESSLTGGQLGPYVVGNKLADGGMGSVYRTYKPGSNDPLVIKVLLPEYSDEEEFRKRFVREVKVLSDLHHPNIIPVHDYGQEGDLLYFVMPLIKGSSLNDLLHKQHFSPATAWLILDPIAQALNYAHSLHIIHRDIKPHNILLGSSDGKGLQTHPYLADFGLSKPLDKSAMTKPSMMIGTPEYMAPEQVKAQPVTHRTDIYALGIVAFEMLLGTVPFSDSNGDSMAIALKQVRELPPYPTDLHSNFPLPLEYVILRALAKAPGERYDSAEAFRQAYWEELQNLTPEARMADYWTQS